MQAHLVSEHREFIYLDNHSTTPCDPRVVTAMLPYFSERYGNPSSVLSHAGRAAATAVDGARERVAKLVGALPSEIVFTGSASESNNLVIQGTARRHIGPRTKIVTTPIEHKSVLRPIQELANQGFELTLLPVDHRGVVDQDRASELIDLSTLLVSVQAANNEIGTLQSIRAFSALAHSKGALMHCDAAQAVGKMPIDVRDLSVDFLSVSAHKMYGPKGVGALFVRQGIRNDGLSPIILGGGQELGFRAGTENVPGIVGFGEACGICYLEMEEESSRVSQLRDLLEMQLNAHITDLSINGNQKGRLPGNSSLTFPGVDAEALILNLPQLALSMGSACNSGALEPSYVLTAIGLSRELASSTIRVGIGRFTTQAEIIEAARCIALAYRRLAELSCA